MSSSQDSFVVSLANSPPPPANIGTYARSMHQHTKRQMEAMSRATERRSRSHNHHGTPSMPNGVNSSSSDEYPQS